MRVHRRLAGGAALVWAGSALGCLALAGLDNDYREVGGPGGSTSASTAASPGEGGSGGGPMTPAGAGGWDPDAGCTPRCPVTGRWSKVFGPGQSTGLDITEDDDLLAAGSFSEKADFGDGDVTARGGKDAFVARFDAEGALRWKRTFWAMDGEAEASVLAAGPAGEALIAGSYSGALEACQGMLPQATPSQAFVILLDDAGECQWRAHSTSSEAAHVKGATFSGGVAHAAGKHYASDLQFGELTVTSATGGPGGIFVVTFDASGQALTLKSYGDTDSSVFGVVPGRDGGVVLAGTYMQSIDFGGAGGELTGTGFLDNDTFVVQLDASGGAVWAHGLKGQGDQSAFDVASDDAGNVVVVGYFNEELVLPDGTTIVGTDPAGDTSDAFAILLNAAGELVWHRVFGGQGDQTARGVTLSSAGVIAITGDFTGTLDAPGGGRLESRGTEDIFVLQLDMDGNVLRSAAFGDGESQLATKVALDSAGCLILTGHVGGSVTFGDGSSPIGPVPFPTLFLAKLAP